MSATNLPEVEIHPLQPFLPAEAKLLMLGSFPPQRKRWSMDFYYPNLQNDMWRIFGLIYFEDRNAFVDLENKCFVKDRLVPFLRELGVALYDTATKIRRLQGNASDASLEVIESTDVPALLHQLPQCRAIVTTGQKATETLCKCFGVESPALGQSAEFVFEGKMVRLYRMPSSSRAYPMKVEKKAEFYRSMFEKVGIL